MFGEYLKIRSIHCFEQSIVLIGWLCDVSNIRNTRFNHRKKCSTVIKLFKKNNNYFIHDWKGIFYEKSNSKLLSNCNSNCRGQPSGWTSWFFLPCTLCTYRDGGFRQLHKKRSSSIIILLYVEQYSSRKPPSTNQKLSFQPWRWYYKAHIEALKQ